METIVETIMKIGDILCSRTENGAKYLKVLQIEPQLIFETYSDNLYLIGRIVLDSEIFDSDQYKPLSIEAEAKLRLMDSSIFD